MSQGRDPYGCMLPTNQPEVCHLRATDTRGPLIQARFGLPRNLFILQIETLTQKADSSEELIGGAGPGLLRSTFLGYSRYSYSIQHTRKELRQSLQAASSGLLRRACHKAAKERSPTHPTFQNPKGLGFRVWGLGFRV